MIYKILLIEDDADFAFPTTNLLAYNKEYEIWNVYNGDDGVAQAKQRQPNLVIVDLQLIQKGGSMDGFSVIQALRSTKATSNVGIIALTSAFVGNSDEIRALRAGADDYVRKDVDFGLLEARIEALLRRLDRRQS